MTTRPNRLLEIHLAFFITALEMMGGGIVQSQIRELDGCDRCDAQRYNFTSSRFLHKTVKLLITAPYYITIILYCMYACCQLQLYIMSVIFDRNYIPMAQTTQWPMQSKHICGAEITTAVTCIMKVLGINYIISYK